MFYYLEGSVVLCEPASAAIDVGGAAYKMTVSYNTFSFLSGKSKARLYTYLSVREDGIELFGFRDEAELDTFKLLTSVSGVGPKAAISLLSTLTPEKLSLAVSSGDAKAISKAPGLGAKTAARIILELKDKLSYTTSSDETETAVSSASETFDDALNALMALGYTRSDATKALRAVNKPGADVEVLIMEALKKLSR
ncbi:MAG: Holliday junction branch migration protein RuvA [Clostridia bacterium]|nr:Holliday junction branch migration protein RuvA [Clostridia bacterium]